MGFSVTLSHVIMVIASVTLASIFSAYAFYTGNIVQSEWMQNVNDAKRMFNMQLEIVHATIDNSTVPPHFVIYVKNVGYLPLNDFTCLDVYVGPYGEAQLYTYNSSAGAGSGQFSLSDANGNGVWDPRETATIRAYPTASSNVEGVMFEAKVVPSRGIGSSYLFPAP
jgi:archaellum component FlaG (FlaF/FlaG flagellin family)